MSTDLKKPSLSTQIEAAKESLNTCPEWMLDAAVFSGQPRSAELAEIKKWSLNTAIPDLNRLEAERDEAHEALRHVHWLMGERDVEKPTIPEWIINDVCNYITSKLPDTEPSQERDDG